MQVSQVDNLRWLVTSKNQYPFITGCEFVDHMNMILNELAQRSKFHVAVRQQNNSNRGYRRKVKIVGIHSNYNEIGVKRKLPDIPVPRGCESLFCLRESLSLTDFGVSQQNSKPELMRFESCVLGLLHGPNMRGHLREQVD